MIYPQYGYPYYPQIQNAYTAPQQQPVNQQIRSGGIVSVAGEDEARRYPVAPGYTVTMRDENGPYLYEKTMGYSQLDQPIFRKARIVFEDDAQNTQAKHSFTYFLYSSLPPGTDSSATKMSFTSVRLAISARCRLLA